MKIQVSQIVEHQLPSFIREEYPLFVEFLKQYYLSTTDETLLQNLEKNVDFDVVFNTRPSATLFSDISYNDTTISVDSTSGFPDNYGLIQIDDEIILYESKTETQFLNCNRGFSGINKLTNKTLEFSESEREEHTRNSIVYNLNILFLQQFALNIKKQVSPGFEDRDFFSELNQSNFIKKINNFYRSKGADEAFRLLFAALYGEKVQVIRPQDFLIRPSDAQWRVTKDVVVELIEGDPYKLQNLTLYQDQTSFIEAAQGTIVQVQKLNDFYVLSLDYDYNKDTDVSGTTKSEFTIHPRTKIKSDVSAGQSYIDVDSTIGFPESGTLKLKISDLESMLVPYESKTLTQFLGCSEVFQNILSSVEVITEDFVYGFDENENQVKMRVVGVLSDPEILNETYYYSADEKTKIETLGKNVEDLKFNNWFFNIPVTYNVKNITVESLIDFTYSVELYDNHSFVLGDTFTLTSSSSDVYYGNISFVRNEKVIVISGQGQLNTNLNYTIKKNISKVKIKTEKYKYLEVYNSNVENIYTDYSNNLYLYSNSLPKYSEDGLELEDFSVTIPAGNYSNLQEITFTNNHPYFTGDAVVYFAANEQNSILPKGVYYVYVVNQKTIKLSKNYSDIPNNLFQTLSGTISSGFESILVPFSFVDENLNILEILPQNQLRQFSAVNLLEPGEETEVGSVGVFINGVDIVNYKSKDQVFYGGIETIEVTNKGKDYDVLNPPEITISDDNGTGAQVNVGVIGSLEKINILDPGFDYVETPVITISGGGGSGADAKVKLSPYIYKLDFSAQKVDIINDYIVFDETHKFQTYEEVIYNSNGGNPVPGLISGSTYYVRVVDNSKIKLHYTYQDSVNNVNTVNLTAIETGTHSISSKKIKNKIGFIDIINQGSGYKNKKVKVSGINTISDELEIINHGYNNGEIVSYYPDTTPISGLTSSTSYYVTVTGNDTIKLSGISTVGLPETFYNQKEYIDLTNTGSGNHYFNYPEIKVILSGKIGINTNSPETYSAEIQPIFSGEIYSVFIENQGTNYGNQTILNYEKVPTLSIEDGKNALLTPIISNGKIEKVIVNSPGDGYQRIPDLEIIGEGSGAILTPIITNKKLTEVKVINGGTNYTSSTKINVVSKGSGAKFSTKIKSRRINLYEKLKYFNKITPDDGVISSNNGKLQYSHLYSAREFRKTVYRKSGELNVPDLVFNQTEIFNENATPHSPLIGWAFDGNPIYGSYGYSNASSGKVKPLKSGYTLKEDSTLLSENRPSFDLYPKGIFIEDYEFTGLGDLDENNGRYCVTPEFPEGTYAYFCTISDVISDVGSFRNYFEPQFPYVIGNSFKNKTISGFYDFDNILNNLLRNTHPYNLTSSNSNYEYIFGKETIGKNYFKIKTVNPSTIDSIRVEKSGNNYKVGDFITLNNGTFAEVSSVSGVAVSSLSATVSKINYLEVVPYGNRFIGICTVPHNLLDGDILTFNSSTETAREISVEPIDNSLTLLSYVDETSATGLTTYFSVFGNLNFPVTENDVYKINNNEEIKILKTYPEASKIKVLRNINSAVGIQSYQAGTVLISKSRKFIFDSTFKNQYNSSVNTQYYFDPVSTIGIGTVGISTLSLEPIGIGKTTLEIPVRSLYIKNHSLNNGDSLFYSTNGGSSIGVSTDGVGSFTLDENQELIVTKISNDLIGISTQVTSDSLYFISIGSSNNHSFTTNYDNVLSGDLFKVTSNVILGNSHNINSGDFITVDVSSGISTTNKVYYNDNNRKLCVNKLEISSVDIIKNNIIIPNHNLKSGNKVIYVSDSSVIGGLTSQKEYYVIVISSDIIKLSNLYYDSILSDYEEINLTSIGDGNLYPVNPTISLIKGQDLEFDVSDSSLSFTLGGISYPAFDLKFYLDSNFDTEYFSPKIIKSGIVGIDTSALYTIKNEDLVQPLYYKLVPKNILGLPIIKSSIIDENTSNIIIKSSEFSGTYSITTTSSTSFTYNLNKLPEVLNYNTESIITYTTDSDNSSGSINSITLLNSREEVSLPYITNIISENGSGAVLVPESQSIGSINQFKKVNIGYNYNSDFTVRPKLLAPQIIKVVPSYELESIQILSNGVNYTDFPDLILIDGESGEKYQDVEIIYSNQTKQIQITKNSNEIDPVNPKVITLNNDNGFEIQNIVYDDLTNTVTVTLKTGFTTTSDYPFTVGEKVFIENVSVIQTNTSNGYNSSNYDYSLFEIIDSTPNINSIGASFSYTLPSGITPGLYDNSLYSGSVVPESYLPEFKINLKTSQFLNGETIKTSSGKSGEVTKWDNNNGILNVLSSEKINPGEFIFGQNNGTTCLCVSSYSPEIYCNVESNAIVEKGWNRNTGFLNDFEQRIHDNDYYQYFSYDLRSSVDYSKWSDAVDALTHPTGFKKFSNMLVDSNQINVGLSTDQDFGEFEPINDIVSEVSLNCFNDFDYVTENYFNIDNSTRSNEIYFNTKILQDFIQSKNNKVILIDDISDNFVNELTPDNITIDSFNKLDIRFKKYLIHLYDRLLPEFSQSLIINLVHNELDVALNQYAISESISELGYFDSEIINSDLNLTFTPFDTINKIYSINSFSFALGDSVGISTTTLGDIVTINTNSTSGIGTTSIIGISTSNSGGKIILVCSDFDDNNFYSKEFNYIQDENSIVYNSYGDLSTSGDSGIGTFGLVKSGGTVNLISYPTNITKEYDYSVLTIVTSDTNFTTDGDISIGGNLLSSTYKQVSSTGSPVKTLIYSHNTEYSAGYHQIVVTDTTNNILNYTEALTMLNVKNLEVYYTEFGNLNLTTPIGVFEAEVSTINGDMELFFTPTNDIDYEVRMFTNLLSKTRRSANIEI